MRSPSPGDQLGQLGHITYKGAETRRDEVTVQGSYNWSEGLNSRPFPMSILLVVVQLLSCVQYFTTP